MRIFISLFIAVLCPVMLFYVLWVAVFDRPTYHNDIYLMTSWMLDKERRINKCRQEIKITRKEKLQTKLRKEALNAAIESARCVTSTKHLLLTDFKSVKAHKSTSII